MIQCTWNCDKQGCDMPTHTRSSAGGPSRAHGTHLWLCCGSRPIAHVISGIRLLRLSNARDLRHEHPHTATVVRPEACRQHIQGACALAYSSHRLPDAGKIEAKELACSTKRRSSWQVPQQELEQGATECTCTELACHIITSYQYKAERTGWPCSGTPPVAGLS